MSCSPCRYRRPAITAVISRLRRQTRLQNLTAPSSGSARASLLSSDATRSLPSHAPTQMPSHLAHRELAQSVSSISSVSLLRR
ncbi:hypothetical protein M0R45_019751 [Rubus argutus]|uniref:Uncharacterized protein n=1 Tax=Rubus argutus TaxID=59490 RepID=A0AAW1X8S4_RUBAR